MTESTVVPTTPDETEAAVQTHDGQPLESAPAQGQAESDGPVDMTLYTAII